MGHGHGHDVELTETEKRVVKILSRAAVAKAREWPNFPSTETGGVMPMSTVSRFKEERQRLTGDEFTEKWRKWRVKVIKSRELHPLEPFWVPELYRDTNNIFRRFYKAPGDYFERQLLKPVVGKDAAGAIRSLIFKAPLLWLGLCISWYSLKYTHNTWETQRRIAISHSKQPIYPGEPGFPRKDTKTRPQDFFHNYFYDRKALLD